MRISTWGARLAAVTRAFLLAGSSIIATALALSACGGGSDGTNGTAGTNGLTTLALVTAEAAGVNCASGGSKVSAGLDANASGVLDGSEVSSVQYMCNGSAGAAGSSGAAGSNGSNGATGAAGATGATGTSGRAGLVRMTAESAGANCADGGTKISAGIDANANGVLDNAEISSTGYVCQGATGAAGAAGSSGATGATGAAGATGATGAAGATGTAGATGATGSNGYNSLIAIVTEAAGANCSYGGNKVSSGLDTNANGALDAGEITATSYNCNGAPGPGITWVDATTSVQAQSNKGYLADNPAQVVVTLPAAPSLGDLVQVTGVGTGGWKIAQNAGQSILTRALPSNASPAGTRWTAHDSARYWHAVASSADGSKLVAAEQFGQLYTSTDSGLSWTARDSARSWWSVASSADGSRLVAAEQGGRLYTSVAGDATSTGAGGSLSGAQFDAIELQYIGGGMFIPLDFANYSGSFAIQ
jgi:hypothetical protein